MYYVKVCGTDQPTYIAYQDDIRQLAVCHAKMLLEQGAEDVWVEDECGCLAWDADGFYKELDTAQRQVHFYGPHTVFEP